MEFKEIVDSMVAHAISKSESGQVSVDKEFGALKLNEKVAEFSEAVLIHNRKCRPEDYLTTEGARNNIVEELADVIGMAAVNAHLYDVNIEQAIKRYPKRITKSKNILDSPQFRNVEQLSLF